MRQPEKIARIKTLGLQNANKRDRKSKIKCKKKKKMGYLSAALTVNETNNRASEECL